MDTTSSGFGKPIQKIPSVNRYSSLRLHDLIYKNAVNGVKAIINCSSTSRLNSPDDTGRTPFYIAVCYRRIEIAHLLLEAGCDPKVTQDNGNTLLHAAVEIYSPEILLLLLRNDTSMINVKNNKGETAVYLAAYYGYLELIIILHTFGASVIACNIDGVTPLLCALKEGCGQSSMFLLENGSDINVLDNDGNSVLHFIIHSKYLKDFEPLIEELFNRNYDFKKDVKWLNGTRHHKFYRKCHLYVRIMDAAGLKTPFAININTPKASSSRYGENWKISTMTVINQTVKSTKHAIHSAMD